MAKKKKKKKLVTLSSEEFGQLCEFVVLGSDAVMERLWEDEEIYTENEMIELEQELFMNTEKLLRVLSVKFGHPQAQVSTINDQSPFELDFPSKPVVSKSELQLVHEKVPELVIARAL